MGASPPKKGSGTKTLNSLNLTLGQGLTPTFDINNGGMKGLTLLHRTFNINN